MKKEKLFKDIGKRVVERGLAEEIGDPAIRDMNNKANAIIKVSKKKRKEASKISKALLKSSSKKSKKKS